MIYLTNAFSLSMLPKLQKTFHLDIQRISAEEARKLLKKGFVSAIGHESTASLLREILGLQVETDRKNIIVYDCDNVVVFQLYSRLPEGKILSKEEIEILEYSFLLIFL